MTGAVITRILGFIERSRFSRFVLSGAINTAVTYAVYLMLLHLVDYRIAYTIAYIVGVMLAYALNWLFVFRKHQGLASALMFPFVYVAQYVTSLAVVWVWVEKLCLSKTYAPLIAIVVTVPLTYVFSRFVFLGKRKAPTLR